MDKDKVKTLLEAWYKWHYTYLYGEEPDDKGVSQNEKVIDIFVSDMDTLKR